MKIKTQIGAGALPLLLLMASGLFAGPVAYTYQGNPFAFTSSQPGPYSTSDLVSGSFTVASALAANLSSPTTVSPTLFSFSDQVQTLTSSTPGLTTNMQVETNASGAIVFWNLKFSTASGATVWTDNMGANIFDIGNDAANAHFGQNDGPAGTWTSPATTAAPEPSTLNLLGLGTVLFALIKNKFRYPGES